ncbi:SDR family oxidoreductase [Agromyces kandeliae]|uniref:SDR family NAD(P)-dependent oxidoreductase n=1 Tax=Agromyces kandeliae TaxID=2666141 RepID=A0A6L5QZT2_9MICO|nr:SDR family oxidoreductase [Agromyces kandeliae]MRX42708.1 SDR family NAD(P)-dependent oxidoreductase [Agromyces kandeliae]
MRVLVTGATGYIGGRLVPRLVEAGHEVRVIVRRPERLRDVPWAGDVEVVAGDLTDPAAVERAMRDIEVVYYLVHSMGGRGDFEDLELSIARNVAEHAARSGARRIVYLGGLHPAAGRLSRHLRSRVRVGEILLASGVPTVVLQAGVVIGSGSTSFEMIRHLTEVLPYMPAPRWVRNFIQPIAVRDVLHYLIHAAGVPPEVNRSFDIGGPDVFRYGQLMNGYAVEAGLRQRPIAALPVLTPWLAGQWVNLVTPIPRRIAVPIIESLQFDCVMREHDIDGVIPPPADGLTPYRRAVRLALEREQSGEVETSWRNAEVAGAPSDPLPSDPDWAGHTVYTDHRERRSTAPVEALWAVIEGVGGENGWYSFPLAWAIRGWIDKLFGGVGLRRGRRDPDTLHPGDAVDFWRVERIERPRFLRLRAEMRVPGRAWLEMSAEPEGAGSRYRQRAVYFPKGLAGRLYWWAVFPFHGIVFAGMANRITAEAEASVAPESDAAGKKVTKR